MQQDYFQSQTGTFRSRSGQIAALIGLIVGLIIGWFVLGWWIAPVRWVNAQPSDLHPRWQQHYVAMVVDSYLLSGDVETASARLEGFDRDILGSLLGEVEAEFTRQGGVRQAQGVQQLAGILGISLVPPASSNAVTTAPEEPAEAPVAAPAPVQESQAEPSRFDTLIQVCGIVLIAVLVVVGAVGAFLWYQGRSAQFEGGDVVVERSEETSHGQLRIGSANVGDLVTLEYRGEGPGYEETFQIYHDDEIVGSCGLRGIPTLSDSGRVAACSVWLYEPKVPELSADTRIIVSPRVFENDALRNALVDDRAPSEVLLAESGQVALLQHDSLQITLEITDVQYADPDEYYISRLVVEMEPMFKPQPFEERPEPDYL